jgi:hypothetical protein
MAQPVNKYRTQAVPDSALQPAYKDTAVDNAYSYDPGILILPVASATPGKVVSVRVHGGVGFRTVSFAATKSNTPPILPVAQDLIDPIAPTVNPNDPNNPIPYNVTDALVGASINIHAPTTNGSDTGYDWSVGGTYTYVTVRHPDKGGPRIPGRSVLPAGRMPYPTMQDILTNSFSSSSSIDDNEQYFLNVQPSVTDIISGDYLWPFTVLPPNFFDPTYVVG